jgi:hypothetical protein
MLGSSVFIGKDEALSTVAQMTVAPWAQHGSGGGGVFCVFLSFHKNIYFLK